MIVRLREWRERRGLSLRALADRAGVTWSTVYRIESSRISPTVAMLEKLAAGLGVDVHDLLPRRSRRPRRAADTDAKRGARP
jgi:transcriptional regulator with XRE-family HTH domain